MTILDPLIAQLDKQQQLPEDHLRLFHGRGHCYPDLEFINIDWFKPLAWVVIYGQQSDDFLQQLNALLRRWAENNSDIACVAIQQRLKTGVVQTICYGQMPEESYAAEDGLRFHLKFSDNQNIGFFADAKPARQWVTQQAANKRVLNLFAYTCSFSVAAIKGGAQSVLNMDMAKSAIVTGQRNHALNDFEPSKANFLAHDIFRSTRKLESRGPYDLIILDPPSRQKGSFEAEKDYPRLLKRLAPMLAESAQILACLNAPYLGENFLAEIFAEHLPHYTMQQRLAQREDFPERDSNRCLKMLVFSQ